MDADARQMAMNALILSPSLLVIIYVFPRLISQIYVVLFFIIAIIPFIKHFSPIYVGKYVYPVAIIVATLIFINSILVTYHVSTQFIILSRLVIPLDLKTAISAVFGIGVIFVIEGLFARKVHLSLGYLFLSLGTFLDQLAIFHVMTYSGYSYLAAASSVYINEVESIITLITSGYQVALPLSVIRFKIDPYMLITFSIAIVGFIVSFLLVKEVDRSERMNGLPYPIIIGALIGFAVFIGAEVMSELGLQIFVVAIAITLMALLIRRSTRKLDSLQSSKNRQ